MRKEDKLAAFDPSGIGLDNGQLYGLPFTAEESEVVVIPVPWEATVSYGAGTAGAPAAILAASTQVDLYDSEQPETWKRGIALLEIPEEIIALNEQARPLVEAHIARLEQEQPVDEAALEKINALSAKVHAWVQHTARYWRGQGKTVAVLGGEHSSPLGLLQVLAEEGKFGILQIDAHADLRQAYEGFTHSHASIMYNALQLKPVEKLVQVGLRDLGENEVRLGSQEGFRVMMYEMRNLRQEQYGGKSWREQCDTIVEQLPQKVYVSFDIDGLDPTYCPNTGTPVPGGLEYEEALYLVSRVVASGRHIIGFDLCEVGVHPESDYDAAVGARVLYRLAALAGLKAKP